MDAEDLRDLFRSFRPIAVRRLFGGAGIYADGVVFALLSSRGVLYLKVDEHNEPDFVREDLPPFEYERDGAVRVMNSYRQMPERLYDDPDELAQWAERALRAAQRKAVPKGTRPKVRGTRKGSSRTARKR